MNTSNTLSPLKIWSIAVRPFAYTASVSTVLLGLAIAAQTLAPIHWGWFVLSLVGVVCFHTAANLINDAYDFQRKLDQDVFPFSGAVVRGLLTERQVFKGALVCLGVGIGIGLFLTYAVGLPVLLLGLLGTVIALGYTGKHFGFKYYALGDLAIFFAFGLIPVVGSYYVQASTFSWLPVIWSVPIALLTVGILHANNWRDIDSDITKNCHTIASLLGKKGSALYYKLLILMPYVLITLLFLLGLTNNAFKVQPTVLLAWLSLPLALKLVRVSDPSPELNQLDGETAKLQLGFSLLLCLGFALSKWIHLV